MALKSDAHGFLVGSPIEWGRAIDTWAQILTEIKGLRSDLGNVPRSTSSQAASTARARSQSSGPTLVLVPSAVSAPRRGNSNHVTMMRGPNGRFLSAIPSTAPASAAPKPAVAVVAVVNASPVRTANGPQAFPKANAQLIQSQNAAMAQAVRAASTAPRGGINQPRGAGGKFVPKNPAATPSSPATPPSVPNAVPSKAPRSRFSWPWRRGKNKSQEGGEDKPSIASRTGELIDKAPDIDPTIAALKEVRGIVSPLGRGVGMLFGTGKSREAWYSRIWKSLTSLFKLQSSFNAAALKALQNPPAKSGILGGLRNLPVVGPLMRIIGGVGGLLGPLLKLGGGLGGGLLKGGLKGGKFLLRRLPLLGALFAGGSAIASAAGFGDDPNATPEENRKKRFEGAGSGVGSLLGGALGTVLGGPAGALIGGVIGDKVGELVGDWLSTVDWGKIGKRITDTWDSAVGIFESGWNSIIGWFKDKFGIAGDLAKKANDAVKNATGVDVAATAKSAAKAVSNAAGAAADMVGKGASVAADYTEGRLSKMAKPIANAAGQVVSKLISSVGLSRVFQNSDGSIEERKGGSVSWRNNNSGNLKFEYAGSADPSVKSKRTKAQALAAAQVRYKGVVDLDQWGNAIFDTQASGDAARAQLLKQSHGNETVDQMLSKYAISDYSGKANIGAYSATINKVAGARGLNLSGKKISELSPAEFSALMDGMKQMEGFKVGQTNISGAPAGSASLASAFNYPGAVTIASVASSGAAPRFSMPIASAAPAAPSVTPIFTLPRQEAQAASNQPTVSQDVSDRKVAHLITGGLGGSLS